MYIYIYIIYNHNTKLYNSNNIIYTLDRETDRLKTVRDRQTDSDRQRQTDKQTETETETDRQPETDRERQTDRQTET